MVDIHNFRGNIVYTEFVPWEALFSKELLVVYIICHSGLLLIATATPGNSRKSEIVPYLECLLPA